mgnify:CR=1 FL=1
MLPSACLPLRMRRYVQKSKFDYFSPDSNVVAYGCKPFRDRQADRWDISLSDIAVCRTSLDSRCKEDPEKGEKIESPGCRFLWYLSVFLVNLVLAILLAAGICLAGYTLVDMLTSENTGIDGIGTALILVFAVWTAALTVFLITMLPQLQMLTVAVLRMMKKLRAILTTG